MDMRSDLFSLGSVLYTMCTGRAAFRAETTMGVLRRVCEDTPRPIGEVNAEIPPWLDAIVQRLMAKNPAERFQTASEVADLLGQHLAHVQSPDLVPKPATVMVPQKPLPAVALPPPGYPPQQPASNGGAVALLVVTIIALFMIASVVLMGIGPIIVWAMKSPPPGRGVNVGPISQPTVVTQPAALVPQVPAVNLVEWGKFVDPVGNCQIERRPDLATIYAPGVIPYNLIPNKPIGMNAPRLMHDAEGDFTLQLRMLPFAKAKAGTSTAGNDTASWRSAGLVLLDGEKSIVRVERVSWGEQNEGAPMAHIECFRDGDRAEDHYGPLTDDERSTMLQMERRGDQVICRFSDDGLRWEEYKIENLKLSPRVQIGLAAVHTTPTEFAPAFENLCFRDAAGSQSTFPDEPGWTKLFNGQNLAGWQAHPPQSQGWTVQEGLLVGGGGKQYLFSDRGDYGDFRLRAEAKINASGDSGILLRMTPTSVAPGTESGYEVQLVGDAKHDSPTASIIRWGTQETGRGAMGRRDLIRPGEWFALEISAIGGQITVSIDGREAVKYRDDPPRKTGHIALQLFSEGTEIAFRRLEIQEVETIIPREFPPDSSAHILTSSEYAWTEPENLGPQVNSDGWDNNPTVSADELTLVFNSTREGGYGKHDLWMSTRQSTAEPWPAAVNLGTEINGPEVEGSPCLSADGLTLLYSSNRAGGSGGSDLWMTKRTSADGPWSPPLNLGPEVNSPLNDENPCLSADGLSLVFCSSREGGPGLYDLWISTRQTADAPWGKPTLLAGVNSDAIEADPCLAADGLTLLLGVMRGPELDIYRSVRSGVDRPWSLPERVGGPLAVAGTQAAGPHLAADARTLYFHSSRPGGSGKFDLWMTRRVPQPVPGGESAAVTALRELVAAKTRGRDAAKAGVEEGQLSPIELCEAEGELIEARIQLAEAAQPPESIEPLLVSLLTVLQEERVYVEKEIAAGTVKASDLADIDARIAVVKVRLSKVSLDHRR
jgi:hypothetical protein